MLEDLDARIAAVLAADGRCSYTELADKVGLSVSAVHQRVRRLEQRGVIRGYAARIDGEQIGLPLTAFVSLTPIDPAQPDDYPQRLLPLTQIEACYSVAGVESYIVKVRVASPAALEALLARIRATANVSTRTTVVLSTPFEDRPVTAAVPAVPAAAGSTAASSASVVSAAASPGAPPESDPSA